VRDRLSDGPSVLMGDFNTPETSKVLTTLRNEAGFIDAFRIANPDSADRQTTRKFSLGSAFLPLKT
jgi:endonuclease/exonuclease/phosphatase family metal-dependent hydrolase